MIRACLDQGGIIELHSAHSPQEIAAILSEQIYPLPTPLEWTARGAVRPNAICGAVSADGFELRAAPNVHSSLIATGHVGPTGSGSTIEIELSEPCEDSPIASAMIMGRYKYDLDLMVEWLKSWIETDDVTEFPFIG